MNDTEFASIMGFESSKVTKLLNVSYSQKWTYEELRLLIDKVVKDPEERYYILTGEHLPEPTPPQNTTKELEMQMIGKLMESTVSALTAQIDKMRTDFDVKMEEMLNEIKRIREENRCAQGSVRLPPKVPEHH